MRRSTPDLDADVRLFHALADPTRLAIVRELGQTASICACDFTATCGVSQPTVSQHLKVLREARIVTTRRQGNQIYYSLDPAAVHDLGVVIRDLRPRSVRAAG